MKISDLTAAGSASGTMQIEVNDAGVSKRVTIAQIKALTDVHTHNASDINAGTLDVARLPASVFLDSETIPLANGGLGRSLTDPNANRLLYWDDANNRFDWLTVGSGITLSGGVLSAGSGLPIGTILEYGGSALPSQFLWCAGQNVSRTTYSDLFNALCVLRGTVTISIASPAAVTLSAHGLSVGDRVRLFTTGALPTGLTANTDYFVQAVVDANTFRLASTFGGAAINTSGTQSGTHTMRQFPHGAGDGSTTFGIPDLRGRVAAGRDDMGGTAASRLTNQSGGSPGHLGASGGAQTHTLSVAELAVHNHSQILRNTAVAEQNGGSPLGGAGTTGATTGNAGSGSAHNNVQPTLVLNKIIYAGV